MKQIQDRRQKTEDSNQRLCSERGIALIVTLAILTVVTLLLLAFAISMRVENVASKNFNDSIKARQLAQGGVDQAVALLRDATPPITAPDNTYVTAPGSVFTRKSGTWTQTKLFTDGTDLTNVNENNLITGVSAGYPANTPIMASWSNVVVNGEIVGRLAFWVDDEAAKVNLNVAGTRANDLQGMTLAAIDLRDLENFTQSDQVNITNYVTNVRPLDTIESVKMTAPPLPAPAPGITALTYSSNKFYMTVNSVSPDLTVWGTKRTNVVWIATNATMTADQKVTAISNALSDVNLKTWFGGQTFADKYPSTGQIAANIVDYIDTDGTATDSGTQPDLTPPAYLGLEQTPYINELVMSNVITVVASGGTATVTITNTIFVELYYLYTNALGWAAAGSPELYIANPPTLVYSNGASGSLTPLAPVTISATTAMPAGNSYVVVPSPTTGSGDILVPATNIAVTITLNQGTITAIYRNSSGRIDYAIIPLTNYTYNLPVDGSVSSTSINWTVSCNDPRVKPVSNNWNPTGGGTTQAKGSLGGSNSGVLDRQVVSTNAATPTIGIRADGDDSCHVVSGSRDRGTMFLGELIYIHTGMPWRTFWLSPQFFLTGGEVTPTRAIPDWAVLDLFSTTDSSNVTGRININAQIWDANPTPSIQRFVPFMALLTNSIIGTSAPMKTRYSETMAVGNIYTQVWVNAPFPTFSPNSFTMIGEACEIEGMANIQPDTGPTYIPNLVGSWNSYTKSQRETATKGIAGLITTRSSVFTVWVWTQTIKKVDKTDLINYRPNLGDIITGEVKAQAIVERYEDPPGSVTFRTRYFRYLSD